MSGWRVPLALVLALAGCSRDNARNEPQQPAGGAATGVVTIGAASPSDSLIIQGEQVYYRGEFDSARAIWRQALHTSEPGDSLTEPRVLTWLSLAAYRQGDYPAARQLGERALTLKLERGLRPELAKSYNALGLLAWNEGRLTDANARFRSTLELATEQGDRELVAKAGNNLGLLQTELGAFDEARANFVAARRAGRALEDAKMEGGALNNLGMLDVWLGNHDAALESLLEAHRLYRAAGYETGEENVFGQLATVYAARGEPHRAFAALDSALAIARKQGMRAQVASNLETMAGLYQSFGDGQRALETYDQAAVINRELDLQVEQGNVLRNQAALRLDAGLLAPARANADEALAIHRTAGARFEELHDLLLLAEIAAGQRSPASSSRYLQAAQRVAGQLQVPIAQAQVALTRARLADRAGSWPAVLRVLGQAGPDLVASLSRSTWEVEGLRSRAHASLGALDSATAAGRRAVAAIERVRGGLGGGPLQSAYVTTKASVYSDLVLLLLRQGRSDEAFMVADGARGRTLLQHLPSVRARIQREGSAHDLAETESLLRRIDALLVRLGEAEETLPDERGPDASVTTSELAGRLQRARSEYEALLIRHTARPAGAALLGGTASTAGEIQTALGSDEALLEYFVTPDRVLIFVLTRSSLRVLESSIGEQDLLARVRLARELFGQRYASPDDSREVAEVLHDVLVGPVKKAGALTGHTRILVVPHGVLNYLPFAALRDPATGRALAEDYSLWSVPTASALPTLRRDTRAFPSTVGVRGIAYVPLPDQLPATRSEAASVR
ncbi:MAG TPA: tetratricopeptide repeat protein, partial [Gemmatimonadales bacterium]